MRIAGWILACLAVAAASGGSEAKDTAAPAYALVERAIRATGGVERLTRLRGMTWQAKGKFFGGGLSSEFTGDWMQQAPDRVRVEVEAESNGHQLRLVTVFSHDHGWVQLDGDTKEMTREETAEAREQAYASHLTRLTPLRSRGVRLESLGEIRMTGRPVAGIKATASGRRDVRLYFDKETGLLSMMQTRVHDEAADREVAQESIYSQYKEVDGLKLPTHVTVRRADRAYLEASLFNYKLAEKLDDRLFEKP